MANYNVGDRAVVKGRYSSRHGSNAKRFEMFDGKVVTITAVQEFDPGTTWYSARIGDHVTEWLEDIDLIPVSSARARSFIRVNTPPL